jgi:Skp family chaperone for outer membrane proteins
MKGTLCGLAVVALLIGFVEAKPGGLPKADFRGDRVGLIDMAHVFKNSKEFTARRDRLKAEIEASDAKSKKFVADIAALQQMVKDAKFGSVERDALEKQLIKATSDYQVFRQSEKSRFLGKEAEIYKDVYLNVQRLVTEHSRKHGFPVVMRFNRSGLNAAKEPKEILNGMNKLVIHYERSRDITDAVLAELNRRYREKI